MNLELADTHTPDQMAVDVANDADDHEAVENFLRPRTTVSLDSMGKTNVDREHSEGKSDNSEEDDDMRSVRSDGVRITAVQRGKQMV